MSTFALRTFYNAAQSARENSSFSPSAGKPAVVLAALADEPFMGVVSDRRPLTVDELALAHDRRHVEAILRGAYDAAMGFCTFNGLMIAAIMLHRDGAARRIGIVDLDVHYGNGTDDIIRRVGIDYVTHLSFGDVRSGRAAGRRALPDQTVVDGEADPWIAALAVELERRFTGMDILFYQAGADPHVNDPLGGALSTEQMKLRDRRVFRFARAAGIPVVWNLAGGYQRPLQRVIDLHVTTVQECRDAWSR
ncbi:MAG: hypothetical protein ACOCYG_04530 [Spirochaetota bacterium]